MAAPAVSGLEVDDVQGLVVRGYGTLLGARYLLGAITDPAAARTWLTGLPIATAANRPDEEAVNVALTARGLTALGLAPDVANQFSHEFVEGMTTPHRQRILGDVGDSAPDRWTWGAPDGDPVHVLLLVFTRTDAAAAPAADRHAGAMRSSGIRVIATLTTTELADREHFGFRDGISQPHLKAVQDGPDRDAVAIGELVLGYPNEYGRLTPHPELARNGTYLVFRQLRQDVRAFWDFCARATAASDGSVDGVRRLALAAKLIGRWPSGAPLALAPHADDPQLATSNDFGYFGGDRYGLGCPVGAHVRRANPRDMLDPAPGTARSVAVNKRHRLLRRGRKYGPLLARHELPSAGTENGRDGPDRGLHFICLGANISRQFEFVQHSWLADPRFNGTHDQVDPLIGPPPPDGRTFSVPERPVRTRHHDLPSVVHVRGGAYFFLPGMRGLRTLAGAT